MTPVGEVGELFQAWATAAGVALVVATANGRIEFANDEAKLIAGVSQGDNLLDAFDLAEMARAEAFVTLVDTTGEPADFTASLAGGRTIGRFLISRTTDERGGTKALIGAFRDVTEQGLLERRLAYDATHDDLTGLLSRAAVLRQLEALYSGTGPPTTNAVLFVDLDDFKAVNDGYGHLAGDEVLKTVAHRLAEVFGSVEAVARMGGDEFLIPLPDCGSVDRALDAAHLAAAELSKPITVAESRLVQRFSIGVAVDVPHDHPGHEGPPTPSVCVERLLAEADNAMYVAKRSGSPVALADESTNIWTTRRTTVDRDLHKAFEDGTIDFHYQPIVDLTHGKWMAAEALLRWDHPELGMLPPDFVVERAETIGLSDELTRYTIERVTRDWAHVLEHAPVMRHHQVALNASARQLAWSGFVETHLDALARHGLDPGHVIIEIVESSEIELHDAAETTVRALAEAGARICLDDFGVGYSALSYFTRFPVHAVKIDRSLVSELRGDGGVAETLLEGVVRIADGLGARVVGEGIETETAARLCTELGMAVGQGWFYGKPMPLERFTRLAALRGLPREGETVVLPDDPQVIADRTASSQPSR